MDKGAAEDQFHSKRCLAYLGHGATVLTLAAEDQFHSKRCLAHLGHAATVLTLALLAGYTDFTRINLVSSSPTLPSHFRFVAIVSEGAVGNATDLGQCGQFARSNGKKNPSPRLVRARATDLYTCCSHGRIVEVCRSHGWIVEAGIV